MENKRYCIFCGAENDADADVCCACGKTMHPKDHLLKDYLYRKTKDSLKGKAEDSFLSVLKNWILSHLYGLVVTVSLITVLAFRVISSSAAAPDYIRNISYAERPDLIALASDSAMQGAIAESQSTQMEETAAPELSEEETDEVLRVVETYAFRVIMEQINTEGGESDFDPSEMRETLEDYYVPESYGYRGAYEFYEPLFHDVTYVSVETDETEMTVNDPSTEIGKQILADGHTVVEYVRTDTYFDQNGRLLASLSFRPVLTMLDGTWYIAEMPEVAQ